MPSHYLSKSDFKASFDCRTKLFYRKSHYPSSIDENEYIQFLADGGFMIEKVAQARYPNGTNLAGEHDPQTAQIKTQKLIEASEDAVVFEAAVVFKKYYARIDILRREGKTLHLIEVKSSSINTDDEDDNEDTTAAFVIKKNPNKGKPNADWKPDLLDVAFQAYVLRLSFPEYTVKPWLCVVDKAHRVTAFETLDKFRVKCDAHNPKARPDVTYLDDPANLKGSKLLTYRHVTTLTNMLMMEVKAKAEKLADLIDAKGLVSQVQEPVADLYKICRKCEYRFKADMAPKLHGFAECWGKMAEVKNHILDLHRVTQIGSTKFPDPVPSLLQNRQASLLDLQKNQLGKKGARQKRRLIQWSNSFGKGQEYLSAALKQELHSHKKNPGWPFHFLDFEACNVALPYHAGLRPYERVAFQWSCHTLNSRNELTHAEWLNMGRVFPNFAFAQSLRQQIGDTGTIYVWSDYEESTLRNVLTQIEELARHHASEAIQLCGLPNHLALSDLANWINQLLGPKAKKGKPSNSCRIRDLHKYTVNHYFHPEMLGRTSIKVVLPAVWRNDENLRQDPWFAEYLKVDLSGCPLNPYKTQPPLPLGEEDQDEESINDGTGAVRIYQDLIFRQEKETQFRSNRERLLKQYCRLDTAAMVMIWKHWYRL
jgi:Domain of unknown function(DUF2779)